MKYSKNTVKWMVVAVFAGVAFSAQAVLIGSESFQTTVSSSDYTADVHVTDASNNKIVVGNTGFGTAEPWLNTTGAITANGWNGMTHSGVVGLTLSGCLRIQPQSSVNRNSRRNLAAVPVTSSTYYLSGLVRLGALNNLRDGQDLSVGFKQYISDGEYNIGNGMHFGMRRHGGTAYLTASAAGSTYDLLDITGSEANVFQIVLKLDANAGGNDTFSAWYAADGDTSLTEGLAATSLETWSDAGYLRRMVAQEKSTYAFNPFGGRFDEIRLGTELADVTTIPEPATLGLIGLAAGAIFVTRRLSM